MTWTRFSYICRRALLDIDKGAPVAASLTLAESEAGSELYGKAPEADTMPRALLNLAGQLPERAAAVQALRTYNQLGLSGQFEEPLQFKRVVAYLSYVVYVFYVVVGIYQLKITPRFIETFAVFELPVPAHLIWFHDYWLYLLGVMSILLLVALLSAFQVRKLFRFRCDAERGLLARLLLGPGLRSCYARINRLLRFPVTAAIDGENDRAITHLAKVQSAGLDMSTEIRELIQLEMNHLLRRCERQLKVMSTLVALVVIVSVFLFLASAYSPIFVLGDVI